MYQPVDAYPAFDWRYERDASIAEAIDDRRAIIEQGTVAAAANRHRTIAEALDLLTWMLCGDDDPGAAVRRYGAMSLEDFMSLGLSQYLDLTGLEPALTDYATNPY